VAAVWQQHARLGLYALSSDYSSLNINNKLERWEHYSGYIYI